MSLTRIGLAFLPVAVLFCLAGWVSALVLPGDDTDAAQGAPPPPRGRRLGVAGAAVLAAEALVLTSLAALWFGSLGHGEWPLLFLLLGLLASGADPGLRWALLRIRGRRLLAQLGLGVAKYLVAGALLSWRLG